MPTDVNLFQCRSSRPAVFSYLTDFGKSPRYGCLGEECSCKTSPLYVTEFPMAIFTPIYSACKNAVHYIMGNHHKKKPETDANKWARKLTQWTAVVAIVGIATVIVIGPH